MVGEFQKPYTTLHPYSMMSRTEADTVSAGGERFGGQALRPNTITKMVAPPEACPQLLADFLPSGYKSAVCRCIKRPAGTHNRSPMRPASLSAGTRGK